MVQDGHSEAESTTQDEAQPPAVQVTGNAAATEASESATQLVSEGRHEDALQALASVLTRDDVPAKWRPYLTNRAAQLEIFLERPRSALARLDELESLLGDSLSDLRSAAYAYGQRSLLYRKWGLLDLAQHWLDRELLLIEKLKLGHGDQWFDKAGFEWISANEHQAGQMLARGDHRGLEALVERALESGHYDNRPEYRAMLQSRLAIGLADAELDDPKLPRKAAGLLEEVLAALAPSQQSERVRMETLLAELALRRHDLAASQAWLDRAAEHMGATEKEQGAHPGSSFWTTIATRLALDSGAPTAELVAWDSRLRSAYQIFLDQWRQIEPREGGYGMLHLSTMRALLSELIRLSLALHGQQRGSEECLRLLMRAQALGGLSRSASQALPTLEVLRDTLLGSEDAGLLIYLPTPLRTHLFVLDSSSLQCVELASRDVIEAQRQRLVGRLMRPEEGASAVEEAAGQRAELAGLLIPSQLVAQVASWKHLTVVGADLLGELPFESLPLGDAPFLGVSHALSYLPSLPFGVELGRTTLAQHRPGDERPVAWIFSAPPLSPAARELMPDLAPIPLSTEQAQELLAPYGPTVRTLAGEQANLSALSQDSLGAARVLQLFTHGVYDALAVRPARLMLAAESEHDGLLRASEIEQLLSPPPVVLLTACRTGRGPRRYGDPGSTDLSGAFLSAGARSVVLSSFDLDAEAARRLSLEFHRALADGSSVAEAMRSSREKLAADPRFADPFYHSLLHVVGRGDDALFPAKLRARSPWWVAPWFTSTASLGLVLLLWALSRMAQRRRRAAA